MNASPRRALLACLALAASICCSATVKAQSPIGVSALATPALVALAPAGNVIPDLNVGVLSIIPDDAYGFFVAANPLETKEEVETVLRKLKIPLDESEDYAEINQFISSLKGWDSKGTHAIALLPNDDDGEAIVVVPVTDYKAFAACIAADPDAKGPTEYKFKSGGSGWIAQKENYAVLTQPQSLPALQKFLDSKKSIAASCEPVKGYLAKHKTALVIAPSGIKKFLDVAVDGSKAIREAIPADNPQSESIKQIFQVYDKFLDLLRNEVTHVAVGGIFNYKVGADFSLQFVFKPDGKLAALSKGFAPLPPDALAGHADSSYIFAGAGALPPAAVDALTSLSMTFLQSGQKGQAFTPEQAKQITEATRDGMKDVKRTSVSINFHGDTFLSGISVIYKVDDAKKFLEHYEKSMTFMSEWSKDKDLPSYSLERKKIDGLDALLVTVDMAAMFKQMGKEAGGDEAKKMIETLFGAEGKITGYLAAVDKETVVIAYDEKALKELVAAVKSGEKSLSDNVQLKKTAALLMSQPHAIGFMDAGGYVDLAKKIVGMMMAAQGNGGAAFPFPIPPFPASPPVGMAGKLTSTTAEFQLVVPMPLMENTRDYILQINALFGGAFGR